MSGPEVEIAPGSATVNWPVMRESSAEVSLILLG